MLSVLIVNWNTATHLRNCLQSLRDHAPEEPLETIVVDNASSDGSAQMVRSEFPEVRLIASPTNTGYAQGNNLAFAVAQGEWLLTLNPDTQFEDDSLDRALERLRQDPKAGCLGIKQVGVDGRIQRSVRGFPTLLGVLGAWTGLDRLFPRSGLGSYRLPAFDYEAEGPAPQPMGTFLLFRREALASIKAETAPFDPRFPIFFNEVDLLLRLQAAGWPCLYTPHAWVRHHGGESTKQVRKSMIWESHRSLVRFWRKHYGRGGMAPFYAVAGGLVWLGALARARGYHAGFRG